jgi:NAD(P)-dependent dehydrogenase (short-subunit alcohol dehydrogenase family)
MKNNLIIAGGSKNLGKYLIEKFLEKFNIINISRTKNFNRKVSNFLCDLSDEKKCREALRSIKKKFKKINAIIICVGSSKKNIINKKNFIKKLNSNFFAVFNVLENFPKIFKKNNVKILIVSSIVAEKNIDGAPIDYTVSKSALNSYVKLKAKILIKSGIMLNLISPGNILLEGNNWSTKLKKNKKLTEKFIKKEVPNNDFINPIEIYELIKLILNTNIKSMVGSNVVIDGGQIL